MFSLTITVDSAAELTKLAEHVAAFDGTATTAPAKATGKATKPAPEKEAPAKEEKAPAKSIKKEPSEAEKAKLYEPVKTIALKLNKEKGRDVLLNVLQAFDAQKAPDLTVDQYDAFIEAAQAELDT